MDISSINYDIAWDNFINNTSSNSVVGLFNDKIIADKAATDSMRNNLNKLDQLQMLLAKYPELSTQDLLNMLGPFAKAALGEDDELTAEEKAEQKQAANNIIEFFENNR